jgi:hypothetical protein
MKKQGFMQHISASELHYSQVISQCGDIFPYMNYDPVLKEEAGYDFLKLR